jgi:hypothetical protein
MTVTSASFPSRKHCSCARAGWYKLIREQHSANTTDSVHHARTRTRTHAHTTQTHTHTPLTHTHTHTHTHKHTTPTHPPINTHTHTHTHVHLTITTTYLDGREVKQPRHQWQQQNSISCPENKRRDTIRQPTNNKWASAVVQASRGKRIINEQGGCCVCGSRWVNSQDTVCSTRHD